MKTSILKHGLVVTGFVVVGALATTFNSGDAAKGSTGMVYATDPGYQGSAVVMRADKSGLLAGRHVDGVFIVDAPSADAPSVSDVDGDGGDAAATRMAGTSWIDNALRFFERSRERTVRRGVFIAHRIGERLTGTF